MILFTLLLTLLDQGLKFVALIFWQIPVPLVPGLLSLRYAENTGIAWSIAVPKLAILIGNLLLMFAIPYFFVKKVKLELKLSKIILSFLMAGALGNFLDRLFRGFVIDYISIGTFPVFNLADALITASVFLLWVFYDTIERKID